MHKCLVCGNKSWKTSRTRPGVIYHGFPKDEYLRRKWLKVFRIDHYYHWQRVCSDHFLAENYKPGSLRYLLPNVIPRPYNRSCNNKCFSSNSATQSKNVEIGNNENLPMEQNGINEECIELPKQSGRKITLILKNEYKSDENTPRLQTDQFESQIATLTDSDNIQGDVDAELLTTMDHTLGYGLQCSIKNCFNRHSKDLSLFGYPKDFTLRKKWIEICGLEKDPNEIVATGIRVCSAHFDDDCFEDPEFKNRLKPDAVPSLFLDDDITHLSNIPSSKTPINRWFMNTSQSSCSSSNYFDNVESNQTPSLVYMDLTTRKAKDHTLGYGLQCSIKNCFNRHSKDLSLFGYPKDFTLRKKWIEICGLEKDPNEIVATGIRVCSAHFDDDCFEDPEFKNRLKPDAVPSLFLDDDITHLSNIPSSKTPINRWFMNTSQSSCSSSNYFDNVESNQTPSLVYMDLTTRKAKDHTLGYGLQCSIKNCFNRHSKDLSLFGYPKDFTLRKKWIEICGLEKDPNEIVATGIRVCSAHFDDDCFEDPEFKNRLKPDAVPSLFLDDDITHLSNIPSSKTPINRWFMNTSQSSCSSSNYFDNVESNQTPSLVYMDLTTRKAKDFEDYCSIPECITNTDKEVEDISLFAPTIECVDKWSTILGLQLTVNSIVCERHFRPQDLLNPELLLNSLNEIIKSLAPNALPVPINKVPILSTFEDQIISPIDNKTDEQSLKRENINVLDTTDNYTSNTSMSIDDSSANSFVIFTLEPIENLKELELSVDSHAQPVNKSNSSEWLEIKTPVTSKYVSLPRKSDEYDSDSDSRTNSVQRIVMNVDNTKYLKKEENGFIFEISKIVVLPSFFWTSKHLDSQNVTVFYQKDTSDVIVKKIHFYNSLVPTIQIYGKEYEYNMPITTKNQLQNLLEKIDILEKCYGIDGFNFENCIGYFENSSGNKYMCSACQGLITKQELRRKMS